MSFSAFLGKGAKYPFAFDRVSGGVKRASSENYYLGNPAVTGGTLEKINGAIEFILSTALESRFFLPTFGSALNQLVFEPNDTVFADAMKVYVVDALARWEKRIVILSVDVLTTDTDRDENLSRIVVNYKVISSQVVGNYVYPFVREI